MVDNYNGSDKDMYRLWKSASDFGVNIKNLLRGYLTVYGLLVIKIIMISHTGIYRLL